MDELLSDFINETKQSLSNLDAKLDKLKHHLNDQEALESIFHIMQTIKSSCGLLGLGKLESLSHSVESTLIKIKEGKIKSSQNAIILIFEAIDLTKEILNQLSINGIEPEINISDVMTKIEQLHSNENVKIENLEITEKSSQEKNESIKGSESEFKNILNDMEKLITLSPEQGRSRGKLLFENEKAKMANLSQVKFPNEINSQKILDKEIDCKPSITNSTVQVNIEILEKLMHVVSELVVTRNQLLQILKDDGNNNFAGSLHRLNLLTSELQEKIIKTRMQPIGNALRQLPKFIKDFGKELGKKVDLKIIDSEIELDRELIKLIKEPLTHLVRNIIINGIEFPEDRVQFGKPEISIITIKSYHQGGFIIIEISDDGKGVLTQDIKDKLIKQNIVSEEELDKLSNNQIYQYIFQTRFSNVDESKSSIGMDLIKDNIEKINGTIELRSKEGKGSTFIIKIPLRLTIMPVLVVEINNNKFGIPQINIIEVIKVTNNPLYKIEHIDNKLILKLRRSTLPLISLKEILYPIEKKEVFDSTKPYDVIICEVGSFKYGILVDKIHNIEEIVVKPVSQALKTIEIYSGTTFLGDNSIIMILDPGGILKLLSKTISNFDDTFVKDINYNRVTEPSAKFLIFKAGDEKFKAVPLDLISRLEEFNVNQIEIILGKNVVKYQNNLMHIVTVNNSYKLKAEGKEQAIVFIDKDKILGLVVEDVLDIIETKVEYIESNNKPESIGSIIINDNIVEIIDLKYLFKEAFNLTESELVNFNNIGNITGTVLLIDNSPFFKKFIPPTISKTGKEVLVAENVEHAIKILESDKKIDVIIADINLPIINGVEFAKICKNNINFEHIPIIALSSNSDENLANKFHELGFTSIVNKTSYDELIIAINKALLHISG
ncbi:MAG: chemotaxis protein CheW [Sphingobacteriia bacterium]|nr:chemotaxis protein CheW [Sphingobacteriia bacterium]